MMDKSIPHIEVIMVKEDPCSYPRFALPDGYRFRSYEDGMERDWAEVETAAGEFDTAEDAMAHFSGEFLPYPEDLRKRMIIVQDSRGRAAGTATLWQGDHFGRTLQRVHWVAVHPGHQGKGIAKALMTRLMDVYNDLFCRDWIYLTTQTWSYPAINIYLAFGFEPYRGGRPPLWRENIQDYEARNEEGWRIIMERIGNRA